MALVLLVLLTLVLVLLPTGKTGLCCGMTASLWTGSA
jgi:hypothetical protein